MALAEAKVVERPTGDRAVERHHEGLLAERCHGGARQPVRMNEIGLPCGAAQRSHHRDEQQRCEPGAPAHVRDDPAPVVGEAEVAVGAGAYDVDRIAPFRESLDRVRDEATREIVLMARIRGREDCDPQPRRRRLALVCRTPRRPLGRSCPSRNALCDRHPAPLLKDVRDQSASQRPFLTVFARSGGGPAPGTQVRWAPRQRLRCRSAAMARRRSSRATSRS